MRCALHSNDNEFSLHTLADFTAKGSIGLNWITELPAGGSWWMDYRGDRSIFRYSLAWSNASKLQRLFS